MCSFSGCRGNLPYGIRLLEAMHVVLEAWRDVSRVDEFYPKLYLGFRCLFMFRLRDESPECLVRLRAKFFRLHCGFEDWNARVTYLASWIVLEGLQSRTP